MTTKSRKERIAEIESWSKAEIKATPVEDATQFEYAAGYNAGAYNNRVLMAQVALEIIRELEAELKVAITALRKIQNVSYPSSSVTWEDCCTAHEKCASEALCKLNN